MALGAVLVACLVAVLVLALKYQSGASARNNNPSPVASIGTVTLFVPERPVYAGQNIGDVPLRETMWPRNQVPEGAVRDRAELSGMFAKSDISPGIPVQRIHLTNVAMSAVLPVTSGNRAVTIEVNATSGLEGLALPGTRVDVVVTFKDENDLRSRVIVQNARVLSSGGNTKPYGQSGSTPDSRALQGQSVKTVTLDVSPKDALIVRTATQLGVLSLVMRSNDDTEISVETEATKSDVGGEIAKSEGWKSDTPGCNTGFYRINGQEFQLNCDGSRFQVNNTEEP